MQAIYRRRATRAYTAKPVEKAELELLVNAAIQAPNAINLQPWAFCIVRNAALLDRISHGAKALMLQSPPPIAAAHQFEEMLGKPDFQIFYHAPALILICAVGDDIWSYIDCTLAAQNLMLAAQGRGLGSCWIGFAQAWLETKEGRAALELPTTWRPVAPIIVGHPSGASVAPPRNIPELRWRD
jgi:nitroreductase